MKRDMDLVRKIVFAIEEHPMGYIAEELEIESYSNEVVGFHVLLAMEAGLVEGDRAECNIGPIGLPSRLTWAGHDFAEAARNDTIWNKAKEQIKEKAGGVTLTLLIEVLKHQAKQALGIP